MWYLFFLRAFDLRRKFRDKATTTTTTTKQQHNNRKISKIATVLYIVSTPSTTTTANTTTTTTIATTLLYSTMPPLSETPPCPECPADRRRRRVGSRTTTTTTGEESSLPSLNLFPPPTPESPNMTTTTATVIAPLTTPSMPIDNDHDVAVRRRLKTTKTGKTKQMNTKVMPLTTNNRSSNVLVDGHDETRTPTSTMRSALPSSSSSLYGFPEEQSIKMLVRRKLQQRKQQHLLQQQPQHHENQQDHKTQHNPRHAPTKSCMKSSGTTTTSNNSSKNNKSAVVKFSHALHVHLIPKLSFATLDDDNADIIAYQLWYSRLEFQEMRERTELIINLLEQQVIQPYNYETPPHTRHNNRNSIIQNEDYSSIGLESLFGEGREISDALHNGGRAAVLLQQARIQQYPQYYLSQQQQQQQQKQKHPNNNNNNNDDATLLIRTAYIEFTERASAIARQRALDMSKAVRR